MASIYRSMAKRTRGPDEVVDGVEPTPCRSINSEDASQTTSPSHAHQPSLPVKDEHSSRTSVSSNVGLLLPFAFYNKALTSVLKNEPHPIILYVT